MKNKYGFYLKGVFIGDRNNKSTVKEVIDMLNQATITLDIYSEEESKQEEKCVK